jgi:hypothetical protein
LLRLRESAGVDPELSLGLSRTFARAANGAKSDTKKERHAPLPWVSRERCGSTVTQGLAEREF